MFPNPFLPDNWGVQDENQHDPTTIEYILVSPSIFSDKTRRLVDDLVSQKKFEQIYRDERDQIRLYHRVDRIGTAK